MRLNDFIRPKCPSCGKELAVHSRYGENEIKRSNRYLIDEFPEYADFVTEWDGRTIVKRYRCSKCKEIYNTSSFGDRKYYNETKVETDTEKNNK